MSKNKVVEFSKEDLKVLIEDTNSCVTAHKSFYNLALYPYHLTHLTSSIKDILNAGVAKYDKKLDGILLGFKNVKIQTPQGAIVTDSCFIHLDIEADFYVFKPEVGATLTGVVNKKSEDHVGCLVHRIFNVSVPNKSEDEAWPGYYVEIGEKVLLQVTYISLDSRLPYIRTSFISTNSMKKKKKKSKTSDEVDTAIGENELQEFLLNKRDLNTSILIKNDNVQTPKTKKKKSKELQNSVAIPNDTLNSTTELKTEKKKKRKSKDKNDSMTKLDINVEEKICNAVNNTLNASEVLESNKKKNRKSKDNIDTPKKLNSIEELEKVSNVKNITVDSNTELKSHKKKKRKSAATNGMSTTLSTTSNTLSKTSNTKVNDNDTDIQALQNSLLAEQIANLNQLETPRNAKKRHRKSDELNAETKLNIIETSVINSTREQKSKKRKSSFTENMSEENLQLHADTTIDDSFKSPKKIKKCKHENSLEKSQLHTTVSNSTFLEGNSKKRKHSISESEGTEMLKKKRKYSEVENELGNLDDSSSVKKKHKSKKHKHRDIEIDN